MVEPLTFKPPPLSPHYFKAFRQVEKKHIDLNNHLNVACYVDLAADCLYQAYDKGFFTEQKSWLNPSIMQLKQGDILFEKEVLLNDILTFHIWTVDVDGHTHLYIHIINGPRTAAYITMTFYNDVLKASL